MNFNLRHSLNTVTTLFASLITIFCMLEVFILEFYFKMYMQSFMFLVNFYFSLYKGKHLFSFSVSILFTSRQQLTLSTYRLCSISTKHPKLTWYLCTFSVQNRLNVLFFIFQMISFMR